MATRKVRKKKRVSRGGKIIIVKVGSKVYTAPLSALGRPVRNPQLNRLIAALAEKSGKHCHGANFAGIFGQPMFIRSFGNGHMPD
jgi:hypothetical protein